MASRRERMFIVAAIGVAELGTLSFGCGVNRQNET
jgi:hypothetical protein